MTSFRLSRSQTLGLVGLGVASAICGLGLRYSAIENAAFALNCDAGLANLACTTRQVAIWLFNHEVFGSLAVAAAAWNVWRPTFTGLTLAVTAAVLGLALYNTPAAALASGLIILSFARPAGGGWCGADAAAVDAD